MSVISGQQTGEYEFDGQQNLTIDGLAAAMKFVGIAQIGLGVLNLLHMGLSLVMRNWGGAAGALVEAAIYILMGWWTRDVGVHFSAIVATQGSDIKNLMLALSEQKNLYSLLRIVFIIGGAILLLTMLGGFLAASMRT